MFFDKHLIDTIKVKKKITYNEMIMISICVIALLTSTVHEVRRNHSIRLKGGNLTSQVCTELTRHIDITLFL